MSEPVRAIHWDGSVLLSRTDWEAIKTRLPGVTIIERPMPARRLHSHDWEAAAGKKGRLFIPPLVPPALNIVRAMDLGPYASIPSEVWKPISQLLTRHGAQVILDLPVYATAGKPYHKRPGPKPRN